MTIKRLRKNKHLSQENLAEMTGLSLRTVQRAESGQQVSPASLRSLAEFFDLPVETLTPEQVEETQQLGFSSSLYLSRHRSVQLIIFIVTFYNCVFSWGGYYSYLGLLSDDASLGTLLGMVTLVGLISAVVIYIFNLAKKTFVWSYYLTVIAFLAVALGLSQWTVDYSDRASQYLLFSVYFTLMTLVLLVFHVMQLALSLKS